MRCRPTTLSTEPMWPEGESSLTGRGCQRCVWLGLGMREAMGVPERGQATLLRPTARNVTASAHKRCIYPLSRPRLWRGRPSISGVASRAPMSHHVQDNWPTVCKPLHTGNQRRLPTSRQRRRVLPVFDGGEQGAFLFSGRWVWRAACEVCVLIVVSVAAS